MYGIIPYAVNFQEADWKGISAVQHPQSFP